MKKKVKYLWNIIKEDYVYYLFLIISIIVCLYPLNYYIIIGGGTSNISPRIEVENGYKSKGSFNICYVKELSGTILSYGLSYIIPTWERESADNYKYTEKESIEDIEFRSDLDLEYSSNNAIYWAYTLANKKVEEKESHIYVISISDEYNNSLKVGDEILSIDNQSFKEITEYINYIQTKNENDEVELKVIRKNKEKIIHSKVSVYKERKLIGVLLKKVKKYDVKPNVELKFKRRESGPSAGLITTLEIYNRLTKKDITKGLKIAGTGTIEEDGTIGKIGGVKYKILGASKDKANIFLVPKGNYKEAKKYIKDKKIKIKLIKVSTIKEVLEKLEEYN